MVADNFLENRPKTSTFNVIYAYYTFSRDLVRQTFKAFLPRNIFIEPVDRTAKQRNRLTTRCQKIVKSTYEKWFYRSISLFVYEQSLPTSGTPERRHYISSYKIRGVILIIPYPNRYILLYYGTSILTMTVTCTLG